MARVKDQQEAHPEKSKTMPWRSLLPERSRGPALEVALDIVERLSIPERTVSFGRMAVEQSSAPNPRQWAPFAAAQLQAVMALFYGHVDRCFPRQGWDRQAHTYLTMSVDALETIPAPLLPSGLFTGLASFCFSAHYLSKDGTRYRKLLTTLDNLLVQHAASLPRVPKHPSGVDFADYDLIIGPTGVGAYLLLRRSMSDRRDGVETALEAVIERLIYLSGTHDGRLRFFIPPDLMPTPLHLQSNPSGCIDCGLAHGVPGPLAFLALARLGHVEHPALGEALRRLTSWVIDRRYDDAFGPVWPFTVGPESTPLPGRQPSRDAWCYGGPGASRALWLAGRALDDSDVREFAVAALRAVRRRPVTAREIPGPNLCHGVAGLLQIVLRFGIDTGDQFFAEMAEELTGQLLELYEPDSLVGFRDLDPSGRRLDAPGLLDGASGVALALLAAATDVEPAWDRLLLLS